MPPNQRSATIETSRAHILEIRDGVHADEQHGMPTLDAIMRVNFGDDFALGYARELHEAALLSFFLRSGLSRVGLDATFRSRDDIEFRSNVMDFVLEIASLRGAKRDRMLSVLGDMVNERGEKDLDLGRLSLLSPRQAMTAGEIEQARRANELMLTPRSVIKEDGSVEVFLADLHYLICEPNLTEDRMRGIFRHGKHAMEGVQDRARTPRPEWIDPGRFFVGAIHVSLGPFIAVIERRTSAREVFHLSARGLDGIRTTGMHVPRQVELFNEGSEPRSLDGLKVRLRIHRVNNTIGELGRRVITPRTLEGGVLFHDIMEVAESPDRLLALMAEVTETRQQEGDYGLLIAGYKCARVPWMETPAFQRHHLENLTELFLGGEPEEFICGPQIPSTVRPFTRVLKYVGGDQSQGKMLVTHAFPDPNAMQELMTQGVGVFLARNLRQKETAFDTFAPEDPEPRNLDLFFDSTLFEEYRRLAERGARLYMAVPEVTVKNPDNPDDILDTVPEHLREFHRGFWVRPEAKERMACVNTIIAMYGSHRNGLDEALGQGIPEFLERMKRVMDEHAGQGSLGLIHGKGPGIMLLADRAAEASGIFRFGVGIELEKLDGQVPNFRPEAIVDFKANDRLVRQQLMDDLATFKVFNIGGAGTLEEAAITMCSQKLMKSVFTPIIFVDPLNLGGMPDSVGDGETEPVHLWNHLRQLIETLAGSGRLTEAQKDAGLDNLNLLRGYAAKYCYFVSSYQEAGDILEAFVKNPERHYEEWGIPKKHVTDARDNASRNAADRGFPLPGFMETAEPV